jgi:hypothetical protein
MTSQGMYSTERKAAERLLITDCLGQAEKRKIGHYGHLINDSVGFMPVPFSAFGSTVPRVSKLFKGIAKRQKKEEVWDNLGRMTNLNPPTSFSCLLATTQKSYPLGPQNSELCSIIGFGNQESDEDENEDDHDE